MFPTKQIIAWIDDETKIEKSKDGKGDKAGHTENDWNNK